MNNLFQWGMGNKRTPKSEQEVMNTHGQDIAEYISKNQPLNNRPSLEEQQANFMANTEMFLDQPEEPVFQPTVPPLPTQSLNPYTPYSTPEPTEPPTEPLKKKVDEAITTRALENPDLSNRQRQAIIDRYEAQHGKFNFGALLAGFGTAMQGKGASGTDDVFAGQRQRMQDELKEFDTNREQVYQDELRERDRETYKNDRDPNSAKSKMARKYMKARGLDVDENFTFQNMKDFDPTLTAMFNEQQLRFNREMEIAKIRKEEEERAIALATGTGTARDATSAQDVRDAEQALESISGNINGYREAMRSGDSTERSNARAYLRSEIADAVNAKLLPSGSLEEFDKLVPNGLFTWNSTTMRALDTLEERIRGNFSTLTKASMLSTVQNQRGNPTSVQEASKKGKIVKFYDSATGRFFDIPKGTPEYNEAIRRGFQNVG